MIQNNRHSWRLDSKKMRLIPYLTLGIIIFSLNSLWSVNWWFKGYFILLEAQVAIVLLFFLMGKLGKFKSKDQIQK